jgi:peptidoglycan/xylan/chitin deacetylase (PgdA/CDA1 family)
MKNRFLSIKLKWRWTGIFLFLLTFLAAGCSSTTITAPAAELERVTAATTAATPSPTASLTPQPTATSTTTPSPQPSPTATSTPRTPPDLPPVFTSDLLKKGDIPHSYIADTCQYLKDRWDAARSLPGTVVMPIMFHSITEGDVNFDDQMTVEAFDELMEALAAANFQAINMEQLIGFLEHNSEIPPRSVLLIVDDRKREAYFMRHFKPYYDQYGWPVVNAWISAVDTPNYLWAENTRLAQTGWVDHQAHGVIHNIPATDEVEDEYLTGELYGSIEAIERHFGKTPLAFIWPGGSFTPRAVRIARQAGYKAGFTVNPRGPLMYNWIPLADEYNPKRPTYLAEGPLNDPLMVLPRYWSTDAIWHIEKVIQIGEEAAAAAQENRSLELEYYDIVCKDVTGDLSIENP